MSCVFPRCLVSSSASISLPNRPPLRYAVLGAGFAGISVAWHLLKDCPKELSLSVDVYDEVGIGGGASGVSGGLLHPYSPKGKLLWHGAECWRECLELLSIAETAAASSSSGAEKGDCNQSFGDFMVRRRGILRPATNAKTLSLMTDNARNCLAGCVVETIDKDAAQSLVPNLCLPLNSAFYLPGAMNVNPQRYLQALFQACQNSARESLGRTNITLVKQSIDNVLELEGFVPKHKEEWKRGNKTSGCVRRKELSSCRQEATKSSTDAFYRLSNVKPPDLYKYAASFADKDQCRQGCLGNCSCTAFAYVTGIGCLLWNQELMDTVQYSAGGEFLSIRLASSELAGSRRTMMIIAGSICLSIFVILAFASYKYWRYRAKRNAWKSGLEQEEISGLTFFEMNTIRAATDNFKISNKLGQGGFGPVYKGILSDRKEIAVKRLSSSSGQGTEEFMNEIKLISKLQHRNLVRLLGCCIDGEEKLLIYEFMVNKSLDSFLFDSTLKLQIDWPKRFNIIEGVARGLLYLHRDSCLKVIHRDMKVSNILLDENMNPKISDFGLARMFQGTQHQDSTRRVVGTIGYMSPEYAWTGMFSEKSDIYAFGVLLLEIISGMKISSFNCGMEGKTLLEYAWESWLETDGVDLLDQDIASSCSPVEVARCVQIGLLCIQQQAVDRPNIAQVVSMITTTTDLPRPQQPVFALQNHDQESTVSVLESVNHMTQTAIYGR